MHIDRTQVREPAVERKGRLLRLLQAGLLATIAAGGCAAEDDDSGAAATTGGSDPAAGDAGDAGDAAVAGAGGMVSSDGCPCWVDEQGIHVDLACGCEPTCSLDLLGHCNANVQPGVTQTAVYYPACDLVERYYSYFEGGSTWVYDATTGGLIYGREFRGSTFQSCGGTQYFHTPIVMGVPADLVACGTWIPLAESNLCDGFILGPGAGGTAGGG